MTLHNNLFCHRLSDHLHCTNRAFTYIALRKDMSLSSTKTSNIQKKCSQRNITQKQLEPGPQPAKNFGGRVTSGNGCDVIDVQSTMMRPFCYINSPTVVEEPFSQWEAMGVRRGEMVTSHLEIGIRTKYV